MKMSLDLGLSSLVPSFWVRHYFGSGLEVLAPYSFRSFPVSYFVIFIIIFYDEDTRYPLNLIVVLGAELN